MMDAWRWEDMKNEVESGQHADWPEDEYATDDRAWNKYLGDW
jgi:hypothetical protein